MNGTNMLSINRAQCFAELFNAAKVMSPKDYIYSILLFLLLVNVVIFFNVPYLRQALGLIFLLFLPGILLVRLLCLDKLSLEEYFVLIIGLSVSFLLLFGLFLNNVSLIYGYNTPLSSGYLMISLDIEI